MKEYNDQELLYLIADGNETASEILYDKYKNIINMKAKKFTNYGKKIGLEFNDLFQEGMVGLSEAIKGYNVAKDVRFSSFANMCIDRQIFTALSKASRKKYVLLNDSFSLDSNMDDDSKKLIECLFDKKDDPLLKIESDETFETLYNSLCNELSNFEKMVFDLKIAGFEYKQIASLLDKSYKSVDSALQRIRLKGKKILKNVKYDVD